MLIELKKKPNGVELEVFHKIKILDLMDIEGIIMKENIPYTKIRVGDVIQLDQSLFKTGKEPKYLSIQRKHLTEMNVLHYLF